MKNRNNPSFLSNKAVFKKMTLLSNELTNLTRELNAKNHELEQANEKLKELDRLKSIFIASMSHELRTPLNSIIGFSYILLNEWVGPLNEEQKTNQAIVLRSGKLLLSLINDVIDISKIEADKLDHSKDVFQLDDLIREVVENFKEDFKVKSLELKLNLVELEAKTDKKRMTQCLMNLISNAIKYTDQGWVSVSLAESEDRQSATITVSDSGIGITEEGLTLLFEPFSRLHKPGELQYQGVGLGLYLTKRLVEDVLKGKISVESQLDQGSVFRIKLPVIMDE